MKKILCVDDHDVNLFTLEAIFQVYQDKYEIITVNSGQGALSILLTQDIDMILLDIMMPGMDGYETARLIKSNKKTKNIPIIFLTAKKDQDTVTQCYEVGGVDYLLKPYNAQELFARVNFHLEMIENKNLIEREKLVTQQILDMQDNLIILSDGVSIKKVNKTVLDFFNVKTHEEFISVYGCICSLFIEEEDYFYIDKANCNKLWLEALVDKETTKESLVLMRNEKDNINNSFAIKVNKFDGKFLVSLTDITLLAEESKENEHAANIDGLTKICNRAKFNKEFKLTVDNLSENEEFSIILFDIDHFKEVNDTYGHLVGDDVLIKLSVLVKSHTRESDVFARWGGEEFMVLLKGVKTQKGKDIAEYLRSIIEVEHFDEVNNITCSFGVSVYQEGDDINSITKRADEALYEAKESGRNKVCYVV